jgi:hypothetical protein
VFFTKRTHLKNADVIGYEVIGQKSELGSFCKKRQKRGKKQGIDAGKQRRKGDLPP